MADPLNAIIPPVFYCYKTYSSLNVINCNHFTHFEESCTTFTITIITRITCIQTKVSVCKKSTFRSIKQTYYNHNFKRTINFTSVSVTSHT